ncbi:VCBS repeat-containing protein [Streptomyces genisteinicus]|uniref:VCBS repeat-containing protein n=1 Tax=Streptomyces genisteinicus TaxID=2768068 RepID=A0A7H0HU74_9ACTN|nr:VCBS repeat-containing protein [Streptomyces genisteinicus]QNP64090.1 VCBS repeat-containing protein [Streptomyces genisteinicus]
MQFRSTGIRLSTAVTAVTAVLAVTALGAGTLAGAPAAFASPAGPVAARSAADEPAAALPVFPEGAELAGTGATGFLTFSFTQDRTRELHWTPYGGGPAVRIDYPEDGGWATSGTDVIALGDDNWTSQMRALTLRNMADPAAPGVDIDLGALGANYVAVLGPTSVLAQVTHEDGTAELHVVSKDGATTTSRKVSGLPADATDFFTSAPVRDGVALVGYATGPEGARTGGRALIELTDRTVASAFPAAESGYGFSHTMFSASHVAWLDWKSGTGLHVTSVDRATGEEKQTVIGSRGDEWHMELVGDWLVYGNADNPVRAVSLAGGGSRDLLDVATGSTRSADGSALFSGRRAADGEGLFRIAAGQDGAPEVTKVAEQGAPAPLRFWEEHVPEVAYLDEDGGEVSLHWTLSRRAAHLDVTLTHIATGKEVHRRLTGPDTYFPFTWDGLVDGVDAPNGRYAVEAEAVPADGVGEPAYQGYFMTVSRAANPHDFGGNGSTDVLARDASGVLFRDDLRNKPVDGVFTASQRARIGGGWQTYKHIEAVGDIVGNGVGDLAAVDGSGVLWTYAGKGDGNFAARSRVGGGWGVYNRITGGSDLDSDGRADLVAADTAGVLWFYKGTGSATAPYAARARMGGGWGVYNQLTAVGDIAGTAAGDLVARDTAGVLWLYQGNGRGNFSAPVRIGGGWGVFSRLVGAGDLDDDGRPDLIAYGKDGTYVYRSTGTPTAPFSRRTTTLYAGEGAAFDHIA